MKKVWAVLFLIIAISCTNDNRETAQTNSGFYSNIEFEMAIIPEPVIPNNTVNILDFGAVSGGNVMNTQAFADAIAAVSTKGGGKVIIPSGVWLTGPITLKSNLELHAEAGAVIKFSTDKDLYPIIETSFEGLNTWRCLSPIYGKNLENIAFTGKGIWDGSGEVWRMVKRGKVTDSQWKKFVKSGGVVDENNKVWYPSEQYKKGDQNAELNVRTDLSTKEDFESIKDFLRPVMVSIQNSKRVMFDGPTFQNSPAWNIHPLMVEDLIVRNITVRNPYFSQNGDGIDIESCKNVLLENSSFDVGDDAICIKSGKDKDGRDRGVPSENLIIRNNVVYHGHGGVTVGSEMSGGVKNMHVSNCTFMGTDVGLRFKSKRGRGGVVENIFISKIQMTDIPTNAISFNLYYGGKSVAEMMASGGMQTSDEGTEVTEETPQFKNIKIEDIVIEGAYQAVFLQGLPEMNLENVKISNLRAIADNGITIIDASGVEMNDIKIETPNPNVFTIYNSKEIKFSNIELNSASSMAIRINGALCEKIDFGNTVDLKERTEIGPEVPHDAVGF